MQLFRAPCMVLACTIQKPTSVKGIAIVHKFFEALRVGSVELSVSLNYCPQQYLCGIVSLLLLQDQCLSKLLPQNSCNLSLLFTFPTNYHHPYKSDRRLLPEICSNDKKGISLAFQIIPGFTGFFLEMVQNDRISHEIQGEFSGRTLSPLASHIRHLGLKASPATPYKDAASKKKNASLAFFVCGRPWPCLFKNSP